jgi:small conductance mechanosensitive channel
MPIEFDINLVYRALTVTLILVVTYILGKITARVLKGTFKKAGIPETEIIIVASIVTYSIYFVGILVALDYIGINIVSFWIALAVGVAILGIAARSTLDNIISGYFLRTYGPFDVGDVIEIEGRIGKVKDLTPLKTVIEIQGNLVYSIPNSKVLQLEIYNFTRYKSEFPVELELEISKEADLEDARLEILDVVCSYPKISHEKPVQISIQNFTEKGVILKVLFFVPDFEIKEGAKDFVASEILKKSKTGEIMLLHSPSRQIQQNPSRSSEKIRMGTKGPKCPACDSRNWHGFLRCRICGCYFIFGKCKNCDSIRLEKCPVDQGELEFIASKKTRT